MDTYIQPNGNGLVLQLTKVAVAALGDLATALEQASAEVERRTGQNSQELVELANAYRLATCRIQHAKLGEAELSFICQQIGNSAQSALALVQAVVRERCATATFPLPTIH